MGTQLIIDANILYTSILPWAKVIRAWFEGNFYSISQKKKKFQDAPFVTQI